MFFFLKKKRYPVKLSHQDDDELNFPAELELVHHVQLENILIKLPELCEIRINFGVVYMNDGFEWRDFEYNIKIHCHEMKKIYYHVNLTFI